jgi:hypothetical protein
MYPMNPTLSVMYVTARQAELARHSRRSAPAHTLDRDRPQPLTGRIAARLATLRWIPSAVRTAPAGPDVG